MTHIIELPNPKVSRELTPKECEFLKEILEKIPKLQRIPSLDALDIEQQVSPFRAENLCKANSEAGEQIIKAMVERVSSMPRWCFFNDFAIARNHAPERVKEEVNERLGKLCLEAAGENSCKNDKDMADSLEIEVWVIRDLMERRPDIAEEIYKKMDAAGLVDGRSMKIARTKGRKPKNTPETYLAASAVIKEIKASDEQEIGAQDEREIGVPDDYDHEEVLQIIRGFEAEKIQMESGGSGNGGNPDSGEKGEREKVSMMEAANKGKPGFSGENSGYRHFMNKNGQGIEDAERRHGNGSNSKSKGGNRGAGNNPTWDFQNRRLEIKKPERKGTGAATNSPPPAKTACLVK